MTSSTPACLPMAFAVRSLSPVNIMTLIPISRSSFTAFGLSALIVSATAMIPANCSSSINTSGVFPCSESASACSCNSFGISVLLPIKLRLPPTKVLPDNTAVSPFPGSAEKSATSNAFFPSSSPFCITAFANGCSLFASNAIASSKSVSCVYPSAGIMSVTFGSPSVMVPVLSSATTLTFPVFSKVAAVLNKIPFFAPTPFPTIMATGVASPSAHGQLMTSTEILRANA